MSSLSPRQQNELPCKSNKGLCSDHVAPAVSDWRFCRYSIHFSKRQKVENAKNKVKAASAILKNRAATAGVKKKT